ncbi:sigma-70 family RNA polymerase sigma factor [bacterium]|nr:sigma-70 family RNA polymerase sigma factor [bacterium]
MNMDDGQLVRKAKTGDNEAFGILVKKYRDPIVHLAFQMTGNWNDAGDLAQETFIKAFQRLSQFREDSKFSTWIYRITVNLSMDHHRRRKRMREVPLEVEPAGQKGWLDRLLNTADSNADRLETEETNRSIRRALNRLSGNQRTAVVLKYFHEKSSLEIAHIMGCSETSVRTHIFRALRNLRKALPQSA